MQKNIWYNVGVPKTGEKKAVPMPVKVTDSIKHELEAIAESEDRPLGYVARELMVRGLALYRLDGRLRDEKPSGVKSATVHLNQEPKEKLKARVFDKIEPRKSKTG